MKQQKPLSNILSALSAICMFVALQMIPAGPHKILIHAIQGVTIGILFAVMMINLPKILSSFRKPAK